jgi:hypothetical protein
MTKPFYPRFLTKMADSGDPRIAGSQLTDQFGSSSLPSKEESMSESDHATVRSGQPGICAVPVKADSVGEPRISGVEEPRISSVEEPRLSDAKESRISGLPFKVEDMEEETGRAGATSDGPVAELAICQPPVKQEVGCSSSSPLPCQPGILEPLVKLEENLETGENCGSQVGAVKLEDLADSGNSVTEGDRVAKPLGIFEVPVKVENIEEEEEKPLPR